MTHRTDPSLSPEFLALQTALAGSYSLVGELGRGGMGVVFLAREVALDRLVAIKMLPLALGHDATLRERFLREARTAAQLAHPHIVPIHAVGSADALVWFVMEYVPGASLGERLRREGALPTTDALRIVQETAWALAHAHARGVIHRDVKPDNILLQDESGRVLVTDFGIAQGGETTDGAKGFGTLHYMSPEQAQGADADARADIYALGITAWHALAGHRPFEGQHGAALLATQSQVDPPSIRSAVPTLNATIAAAIDRAVTRDPDARWTTMEEFARALDSARALTPPLPVLLRRFGREAVAHADRLGMAGAVFVSATIATLFIEGFLNTFLGFEAIPFLVLQWVAGGVFAAFLGAHVVEVRRIAARGYAREAALRAITELEAEESLLASREPARWWRSARGATVAGVAALLGGVMITVESSSEILSFFGLMAATLIPAQMVRQFARARGTQGSWWTRLLRGRWGARLWGAMTLGVDRQEAAPMHGEPTALALGGALHGLYDALPDADRRLLAEVPDLITRLEAVALDRANPKRIEAVTALETLRLDLLKLRAGQLTADGMTEDLERVLQVGRYADARGET